MTSKYVCIFRYGGESRKTVDERNLGIMSFCNGFWINKDLQFTTASDCELWIPPHQIEFIEKIVKGD